MLKSTEKLKVQGSKISELKTAKIADNSDKGKTFFNTLKTISQMNVYGTNLSYINSVHVIYIYIYGMLVTLDFSETQL